jgi:hypothetical protein
VSECQLAYCCGMATLSPQAALEQAALQAILATGGPGGQALPASQAARMYDGQPPARAGKIFYSVWSDNGRPNAGQATRFQEAFSVFVTITVRLEQPPDMWLLHRDDLERRANAVRALLGQDQLSYSIINAANTLAGLRSSGNAAAGQPVGWCLPLLWRGMDPIKLVGPDWFDAETKAPPGRGAGVAQRLVWGNATLVQAIATAQ